MFVVIILLAGSNQKLFQEKWAVVQKGPFKVYLIETGEVEALSQKMVTAPMMWSASLQIIELIPEGSMVKQDDFLIHFDASDLELQIDLDKDRLITLNADLDKLKAQQSLTMSDLNNSLRLSKYSYDQAKLRLGMREFESDAMQEEARLQVKQAEIDLERVKKQLKSQKIIHKSQIIQREMSIKQAENRVKSLQDRINMFTLRAPCDGIVVYQEVGRWTSRERLKKGYTAHPREDLISIPDLSKMQVKLYVNEVDRLKVHSGQKAEIVLDAYPEKEFRGTVRDVARLAQKVTAETDLKGFAAYVDIEGSDQRLKPGMTAKVTIILEEIQDVVYIPAGTIFEVEGQPVVFLKGKYKPHAVYLGQRNDEFFVVKKGLKPGTKLSWKAPEENALLFGSLEEKKRIAELNRTIKESFSVFKERGILFDYYGESLQGKEEDLKEKPKIDLDKLPPSIRERLKSGGTQGSKPEVKVGSTEDKKKEDTFTVSPEMMKRLKEKK